MRYFGAIVFGTLTLLAGLGWWFLASRGLQTPVGGGVFFVITSPILFLILVGPFATMFLACLFRAFRE